MNMTMRSAIALASALLLSLAACAPAPASSASSASSSAEALSGPLRVAGLKGPTSMGMVKLMSEAEAQSADGSYEFSIYGTADELVAKLSTGELDAAALPCNLAAVLYQKTKGQIKMAAINTLGVLYVLEVGDSIESLSDLKGRTVTSTGRGTTPEYSLNYLLRQSGLDPQTDLTVDYRSEATEVAALLTAGQAQIALLPQPYVSTVLSKVEGVRVALDLSSEWEALSQGQSALITGVLVVRNEVLETRKAEFNRFLEAYRASIEFANAETAQAAELVAHYGIVPSAELAARALPACNLAYIDGDEMRALAEGYLTVLFDQEPASVGGALPDEAFYYQR